MPFLGPITLVKVRRRIGAGLIVRGIRFIETDLVLDAAIQRTVLFLFAATDNDVLPCLASSDGFRLRDRLAPHYPAEGLPSRDVNCWSERDRWLALRLLGCHRHFPQTGVRGLARRIARPQARPPGGRAWGN